MPGGVGRDTADELSPASLVVGVTTAATLWYVTVVGLCFGGGQMLLGWLATAVGAIVLWGLRWIENIMSVEQHASLAITLDQSGPKEDEIRGQLAAAAISVRKISVRCGSGVRTLTLNVSQSRRRSEPAVPAIVEELTRRDGVVALEWRHLH
jgi:putative Mg2+ transporter-C (MgtC) family protein